MALPVNLIGEFNAIKTVEELNEKAPKLHNFFQTVTGLTRQFKFLDINTISFKKKSPGPNEQKKQLCVKDNKHEIQALFDRQQHRAVQEILIGPTMFCAIPQEEVENRYKKLFSEIPKCNISELPPFVWQSPALEEKVNESLIKNFTLAEVKNKLLSKISNLLANSRTVGLDKITYRDLLYFDQNCLLLTSFFNACLRVQAVPDIWKKMFSVLVKNSKEVDANDIKNWHPISMINSIPKLFQSLITARLILWAKNGQRLSPTQKRLLMYNAACESSFILQQCQNYAEENDHDLAVAWLDYSNASDSIPQEAVLHALVQHSVPVSMRNIIESSIKNVDTKIRLMLSDTGFTNSIPILNGIPQGYPLNPILLDLVLEPVLRTLAADSSNVFQLFNKKINHLAIPNELVLIAESTTKLQNLLKLVENTAKAIGLQFKINNCTTYHYDSRFDEIKDTSFSFFGQKLTALPEEKIIEYFGVRQGLSIGQNGIPTVEEMIESVDSVSISKLNTFQKSEAIQNFVMPRAENCLRGLQNFDRQFIAEMDKMLQDKFKSWLAIPEDSDAESIVFQCACLSKNNDKSSYLPLIDLFNIMKIAHAFEMLTSNDQTVKNIALDSLTAEALEMIKKKSETEMTMDKIIQYLSGEVRATVADYNTVWKTVRHATLNLKKKIKVTWQYDSVYKEIQIVIRKSKKTKVVLGKYWSTDVSYELKSALIDYYIKEVIKKNPEIQNPRSRTGLRPISGPTNTTNVAVLQRPSLENAVFNMLIGFPTIYGQRSFISSLIY